MDNEDKSTPRGFAGLDEMVSDLDTLTLPPLQHPESPGSPEGAAAPVLNPRTFQVNESVSTPRKSNGKKTFLVWSIGIGILISLIFLSTKNENSSSNLSNFTPTETTFQALPTLPATYEERPPPGDGLVFSDNQIRYCLSQDIRLAGWSTSVNNYSANSVNSFNLAVSDYNSRCAHYKYRRGALDRIRSEVERRRVDLQSEGLESAAINNT